MDSFEKMRVEESFQKNKKLLQEEYSRELQNEFYNAFEEESK